MLLLGFLAPWLIQSLLMLGGAYLCFEGYEKIHSIFKRHHNVNKSADIEKITPEELEKIRIKNAVRTDLILSAEIIAITYATVAGKDLTTQVIVILCVAIFITAAVYGFVGLIVKADDIGLHIAKDKYHHLIQKTGRGIVIFMPHFLKILSYVGTAAMLWVGAEIIAHGIPFLHHQLENLQHFLPEIPILIWGIKALLCAIGGIILGAAIEIAVRFIRKN